MKKIIIGTISTILFFMLAGCSQVNSIQVFDQEQARKLIAQTFNKQHAKQMIALSLPHHQLWQRPSYSETAMLLPAGQTPDNWQQSIQTRSVSYALRSDINVNAFSQYLLAEAKADCRQADMTVTAQTSQYLMYRMTTAGCKYKQNRIQIGKIFNGIDATYAVMYSAQQGAVSDEQIQLMSTVIANAQLVKNN